MIVRDRVAIALALLILLAPTRDVGAQSTVPTLRGIAIDQRLDAEPLPANLPGVVPTIVRLSIEATAFAGPAADATLTRLQTVLGLYESRHMTVVLSLGGVPAVDTDVESWRHFVGTVADRGRGHVIGYQIGEVQAAAVPDVNRYVYLLKLAAVQIRSIDSGALILQGNIPASEVDWQGRVFAAGAGPYVDGIALDGPAPEKTEELEKTEADAAYRSAVERMVALIDREKASAILLLGPIRLPADPAAAISRSMDAVLRFLGTSIHVTAFAGDAAALGAALAAAARLSDLTGGEIVTLDERTTDLRILQGTSNVTTTVPHRLVYSLTGFQTFFVYWSVPNQGPLDVEITVANATTPMVRDPMTGMSQAPARVQKGSQEDRLRMTLPTADHPLIVDFNFGNGGSLGASVDVRKDALPRVEEIIFRHQQAQAAQDAVLQNYIAHVRMEQHFHPSPADPAYNLVTENRLFSDHGAVEWEELSFELNGAKWTANRPSFPLVQPEKVLSLPLDLRLNQDYAYRLDGVDTIGGRPAFVVRFDPVDATHALYRGTVWIDRETFVRLKVQAVETKLDGAIVSNDETSVFEPAGAIDGRTIWLLTHLSSKQIFLIGGRSVLIEREIHLSDFALNASDFDQERSVARASNQIMYRDTDEGVRYLVKQGETRVVSNQMTTSARALVLGADIDPSFNHPLPIGGINILDFNFLKRNLQLALLYGGVIAFGNIQHANLWGGKFDASVDFFGLALKSNDDVFDAQGRQSGERVDRIPAGAGFNLGYQVTPFQKISGHYEFKYDAYFRDDTTASSFVIPSSTATNGEGLGYEYRRRGYSLLTNVAAYRRARWNAWGLGAGFDPRDRTYTKYDLGLSKDFTFATFHTIHLNGTYFGGQRLDRFSEYQFGLFDATRMHGVPSAVRFGELAMFRGSYSFNLFDQYRLDLFVDHASGRDPQGDNVWRQVTGTGIRLNLRAPGNTILQVDFGKSILPDVVPRRWFDGPADHVAEAPVIDVINVADVMGDNGCVLRADLHLHSYHSGHAGHLKFLRARDCYSEPDAVYAAAKARGMDIVTITDHDSIDGCLEFLESHPDTGDFFISEEIECRVPDVDLKVHIGAYGISERIHRDIQPLRKNVFDAAAYLRSEGIFYALNHPFFFFKGQLPFEDYLGVARQLFPAFEVRNGTMLAAHNELVEAIIRQWSASSPKPLTTIGGSDSHTLAGIGTMYTEAPGTTRDEFLQSLRNGRARVGGRHGSTWREAREIYGVIGRYWATLLGAGRQELSWPRRTLGLAFSALSLPFEFSPLLVATRHKRDEARRVMSYRRAWEGRTRLHGNSTAPWSDDLLLAPGAATDASQ